MLVWAADETSDWGDSVRCFYKRALENDGACLGKNSFEKD